MFQVKLFKAGARIFGKKKIGGPDGGPEGGPEGGPNGGPEGDPDWGVHVL